MKCRLAAGLATALLVLTLAHSVCAQNGSVATDTNSRLVKLEQQAADAKNSADNAWMLTSAALVLMMTGSDSRFSTADWCERRMCWPR